MIMRLNDHAPERPIFHEPGLPCDLPSALEEGLKDEPQLRELERKVPTLLDRGIATESHWSKRLESYRRSLWRQALLNYHAMRPI